MTAIAQVIGKTCTDPSRPLYPPMDIGSGLWFSWLREPDVRSFHFESECGKFTARKEERATSTNEYWYAYRKLQGKLRKVYLGAMDELCLTRLNQIAAEISQSGEGYYYSRKNYLASKEQNSIAGAAASLTLEGNGYPIEEITSCVTDNSELEVLRSEVEQLRSHLLVADQESRELRLEQQQTDEALSDLLGRIGDKDKGYLANSFSQGIKEIRSLAERRGLLL